jgi:tetratricopeptide (TPR) repeat protein
MPGHIFARLGMWTQDIDSNVASVEASQKAVEQHHGGAFDQLHADDFLLYAYLQSGQESKAKSELESSALLLNHVESMPGMVGTGMEGMVPYYRTKFPVFYFLERRDWQSASALAPVKGAPPQSQTLTYWARIIANGHLKQGPTARANLKTYDGLVKQIKKGKYAYAASSTGAQIENGEVIAWTSFAEGNGDKALIEMRKAADLQDKVGQGEVDIPAREMLADMLLALRRPQEALVEYESSLKMSPKRFNGLYNAGMAAEAVGDKTRAAQFYATLLNVTANGAHSDRTELTHAKSFLGSAQMASK